MRSLWQKQGAHSLTLHFQATRPEDARGKGTPLRFFRLKPRFLSNRLTRIGVSSVACASILGLTEAWPVGRC